MKFKRLNHIAFVIAWIGTMSLTVRFIITKDPWLLIATHSFSYVLGHFLWLLMRLRLAETAASRQ